MSDSEIVGEDWLTPNGFFAARGDREGMSNAALAVLSQVQDQIVEAFGHGWPGEAARRSGQALPLPYARVSDTTLLLGYVRDQVAFPLSSVSLVAEAHDK
jgi:hypothetical protein